MIAVSYEARAASVKRSDRGMDAVKKCPGLYIVQVPVKRGKANLAMYRNASLRVMKILVSAIVAADINFNLNCNIPQNNENVDTDSSALNANQQAQRSRSRIQVEKASIDEIYIDMTLPATEMASKVIHYRDSGQSISHDDDDVDDDASNSKQSEIRNTLSNDNHKLIGKTIWQEVVHYSANLASTTVGGVEQMSDTSLLANQLTKDDLRKGSHLQILDSQSTSTTTTSDTSTTTTTTTTRTNPKLDENSQSWWHRPIQQWTDVEIKLACGSALAAKARMEVATSFQKSIMRCGGTSIDTRDEFCESQSESKPTTTSESKSSLESKSCHYDIFTLSAGISSNKTLAKLASGLKKPNRQTLINPCDETALSKLFHPLPINRLRGLGGKFGHQVSKTLNVQTVGDLSKVPLATLQAAFPASSPSSSSSSSYSPTTSTLTTTNDDKPPVSRFLYSISRGICTEQVSDRTMEKSISSGKTFRGQLALPVTTTAITTTTKTGEHSSSSSPPLLQKWITELTNSLMERLEEDQIENQRRPSMLVVSVKLLHPNNHHHHHLSNTVSGRSGETTHTTATTTSRSCKAPRTTNIHHFSNAAYQLLMQMARVGDKILNLTVTATAFVDIVSGEHSIEAAFSRGRDGGGGGGSLSFGQNDKPPRLTLSNTKLDFSKSTEKKAFLDGRPLQSFWTKSSTTTKTNTTEMENGISLDKKQQTISMEMKQHPKQPKSHSNSQDHSTISRNVSMIKKRECNGFVSTNSSPQQNNNLDKSILSQLPPSIQSEIRVASMSCIGRDKEEREKEADKTEKKTIEHRWLPTKRHIQDFSTKETFHKEQRYDGNTKQTKSRSIKCNLLTTKNNSRRNNNHAEMANTEKKSYVRLREDQIDPAVLNELPDDIQSTILQEIQMQKKRKVPNRSKRIESFFEIKKQQSS